VLLVMERAGVGRDVTTYRCELWSDGLSSGKKQLVSTITRQKGMLIWEKGRRRSKKDAPMETPGIGGDH